jgi:hypothetical protein
VNGPGIAFAEQVRFVTVAGEVTAAGFRAVGRRALRSERVDERRDVTEASRHLGEVAARWEALAPDAVGLRALASDVRAKVVESAEFAALTRFFDEGPLREVAFGLLTALRSATADRRNVLSPTADRALDLALAGIDLRLEAAQQALGADHDTRSTEGALRPSSGDDGSRTSDLALSVLLGEQKDFSSPLGVSKSGLTNH